jgi:hypothetical protein
MPAPAVTIGDVPALTQGAALWQAPFDDVPKSEGGVFIGPVYPTSENGTLQIIGVDETGATMWSVHTNPSCAGYGISRTGATGLAIVLHSDVDSSTGKLASITASAFDTATGDRVWGPVSVPGPLQGPGLIFGQTAASVVGGAEGPKTMLAARDGKVVARQDEGVTPLYEHNGVGLVRQNGELRAIDTGTGTTLWSSSTLAPPRNGWRFADFLSNRSASDRDIIALRWVSTGGSVSVLHDLASGRPLVTLPYSGDPYTTVDPRAGIIASTTLDSTGENLGLDRSDGRVLWRGPAGDSGLNVALAEGGIGYGTKGSVSIAVDLRTGNELGSGSWPVPVAATPHVVLAPLPVHPGQRPAFVAFRRTA